MLGTMRLRCMWRSESGELLAIATGTASACTSYSRRLRLTSSGITLSAWRQRRWQSYTVTSCAGLAQRSIRGRGTDFFRCALLLRAAES